MHTHHADIAAIEDEIAALTEERKRVLGLRRALRAQEVDRVFEINLQIEWCFEKQAMLLPLLEEERSAGRWDPLSAALIAAVPLSDSSLLSHPHQRRTGARIGR